MIAYISLEYSSEGPPPSQVDRAVHDLGLRHHGTYYLFEAESEEDLHRVLDRLHDRLRGTGARYRVSLERPDKGIQPGHSRAEVLRWVDAGIIEEDMVDLLERDAYAFKQEALRSLSAAVDHVMMLRSMELQAEKDRRHREAMKEEIGILLRSTGGRTFQEVLDSFDIDEMTLEELMQEMIDESRIKPRQSGHIVIYTPAAPPARPLAR